MRAPFDSQPTLYGTRLLLRPLRADDRTAMFSAASDPKIWEQHPSPLRYTEPEFRLYFDAALASGSALTFVDRMSGEIVGSSRYHGADADKSEIEIGWTFLVRRCWGGALNLEAKTLMLEHAFRCFHTVIFWVGQNNHRSSAAMLKLGAVQRDGVVTRAISGDAPYVVFEIRRQAWAARRAGQVS
jgi:N-acetyltransferase